MATKKLSPQQARMVANIKAGLNWGEGIANGHINILRSLVKLGAINIPADDDWRKYTVNPGW